MTFSPQLLALAKYLAGEFENSEQARDEPVWYVHLRLWQRPIKLFAEDSLTLFAEQANIINLAKPYRQRIMRLQENKEDDGLLKIQYYMPLDPGSLCGGGQNPAILNKLTPEQLELLPSCILNVNSEKLTANSYKFIATPPPNTCCSFSYLGNTVQVNLGLSATETELLTFDKGIDPVTGKATWGAMMGPYRYTKTVQY